MNNITKCTLAMSRETYEIDRQTDRLTKLKTYKTGIQQTKRFVQ